jgi:hypothetical protein
MVDAYRRNATRIAKEATGANGKLPDDEQDADYEAPEATE